MRIQSVNNAYNYNVSYKGTLSPKMCTMIDDIQDGINKAFSGAINRGNKFVLNTSKREMTEKLTNIFDNLYTMMERFGQGCQLTFEQSTKSQKQRFYIENKSSYYKMIVGDTQMPRTGHPKDISGLEKISQNIEKINPYEANLKFMMGKKSYADEKEFIPDEDYIIVEDKLIKD